MEILSMPSHISHSLKRPFVNDHEHELVDSSSHSHIQLSRLDSPSLAAMSGANGQTPHSLSREGSPALSTSTLSSIPTSTAGSIRVAQSGSTTAPPAKRRKLSPEEKLQRQAEKDAKARDREEKRIQKEAENAIKEEERRVRADKKRQEAEVKEESKRQKDLIKQQKEEEEAKKQRAQLRLGSFFAKTVTPKKITPTPSTTEATPETISRLKSARSDEREKQDTPHSPEQAQPESASDYTTYFLPFALPSNSSLIPQPLILASEAQEAQDLFDGAVFNRPSRSEVESITSVLGLSQLRPRGKCQPLVHKVMERLSGTEQHPMDLTAVHNGNISPDDLSMIDMRHIQFSEDVRPPYTGSYTRINIISRARKAARTPMARIRDDTNYDYDSEAEWEEPEEGEELLSDGEEDLESVGSADEMEGFLDDGEAENTIKRGLLTSESEPISSGICWESAVTNRTNPPSSTDFSSMRLEWLIETRTRSINPLSDTYWAVTSTSCDATMKPPRAPLLPVNSKTNDNVILNAGPGEKGPIMVASNDATKTTNTKLAGSGFERLKGPVNGNQKIILNAGPGEKGPIMAASNNTARSVSTKLAGSDFERFKEAVNGSNLKKSELLKTLKKRFPSFTNESIKETLGSSFARIGPTADTKVWRAVET